MPDLNAFFQPARLFDSTPGSEFKFYIHLLVIFGVMIFLAVVIWIFVTRLRKHNPVQIKLGRKVYYCLFVCGSIGFVLLFFRYQNISFLSSRFLLLVLFLVFVIWLGFILFYFIKKYQDELAEFQNFVRKIKYMPKSRKKK